MRKGEDAKWLIPTQMGGGVVLGGELDLNEGGYLPKSDSTDLSVYEESHWSVQAGEVGVSWLSFQFLSLLVEKRL